MRVSRLWTLLFAALCCFVISSQAQGQGAYGYASITYDDSSGTVTGYASTEIDYETAYYYDAQIDAHIEDENGNVLASGSSIGNPTADTFLDVFDVLVCVRYTIFGSIVVAPRFLGCSSRRYFDPFGFSDLFDDYFWDYGYFFGSRRTRCIFGRLIFIGSIIADVIRCLPASVQCQVSSFQVLPKGMRDNLEKPYISGLTPGVNDTDHMTVRCHATTAIGEPVSGLLIRFGFGNNLIDDGGHQNHSGKRPTGDFNPTAARTGSDGWAQSVYTASPFGGSTEIIMSSPGSDGTNSADIFVAVPGLQALPPPTGNDGYVLKGSSESGNTQHPNGHYGTPGANNGLRQIAAQYRDLVYPNGQPTEEMLVYNDQSLRLGGKFDITKNFATIPSSFQTDGSHDEHRVGINADVRLTPDDFVVVGNPMQVRRRRRILEDIFAANGSTRTLREFCKNHWHLRFEFGSTTNTEGEEFPECNTRRRGSAPALGGPAPVPGMIEAELYDSTGTDGTQGSFVPDDGLGPTDGSIYYNYPQVLPIPGNEGNSYVPTVGGQWMSYTVNVSSSGSYSFTARVASPYSGNTFHFEVDGVDVTGPIYIPNTGSWNSYQFVNVDNIWIDAGQPVISLVVDGSGPDKGNFDSFSISPYVPPPICDPEWWEINNCQMSGGYWDYSLCQCNYGWWNQY